MKEVPGLVSCSGVLHIVKEFGKAHWCSGSLSATWPFMRMAGDEVSTVSACVTPWGLAALSGQARHGELLQAMNSGFLQTYHVDLSTWVCCHSLKCLQEGRLQVTHDPRSTNLSAFVTSLLIWEESFPFIFATLILSMNPFFLGVWASWTQKTEGAGKFWRWSCHFLLE